MSRKRKVLFLIYSLCGGGAERVLVETVNSLAPEKYDITLQALFHDDTRAKLLAPHVHYRTAFRFRSAWVQKLVSGVVQYLLPPKWVYQWFFKGDHDVEVAFMEAFPTKMLAGSTNRKAKKYAWVHIDVNTYTKQDRIFRSLAYQKHCYEHFDRIYCVSENVRDAFVRKFGLAEKTSVVYNILDDGAIRQKKDEPCIDLPRDKFLLVSVGSLIPRKGFGRLIDCCARLKAEGFDFRLCILGKGELEQELTDAIHARHLEDTVHLLGFRTNPYPYIAAADLYVCPSYVEGFSTVVSEAVVLGVPVLTTDSSGMREILGDSEYGLITANDDEALCQGLRRMLSEPETYRMYQQKVKERSSFFSLPKRLAEYEAILDQ